ncbi:Ribonuclease H domain [Sesbania bispinosa]|nr:Ribonuclease H domain [Sesbania bispinosa]
MLPVNSFSDSAQDWKLDSLRALLPLEVVEEIAAHLCPCEELGTDSVIWGGTSNGAFSTKSAYNIIRNPVPDLPDPIWSRIWSWEGPERAKCLLWVILNKGLKTRSKGFNGGFMDSNLCPLCMNYEETSLHILRDCCHSRAVWLALSHGVLPGNFSFQNLSMGISSNLDSAAGHEWSSLFSIAIWLIWQSRNAWVFEGVVFNSSSLVHKIIAYAQAGTAIQSYPVRQSHSYRDEFIKWSFPDPGWLKINVDGSVWKELNWAGCGGVVRGADGKWMLGFSMNLGKGSVLLTELRAIEMALRIAWNNRFTNVCVESDSLTAISLIQKGITSSHPFANILKMIQMWNQKDWRIKFSHTFREGNRIADWLANSAHSRPLGLLLIIEPPRECLDLIWQDSVGVALSHSVLS